MNILHSLKTGMIHFLKRHERLDSILWRFRHPFRADQVCALEAAVKRHQLEIGQLQNAQAIISQIAFHLRAAIKSKSKIPINVLFICHEPAMWSMYDTIYRSMDENIKFNPVVVSMPYTRFGSIKDAGMHDFCMAQDIHVVEGYDYDKKTWLNPLSLAPDYVFFQTPYSFFPEEWGARSISLYAKICYIPYGTTIFRGEVYDIVHPEEFIKYIELVFKENEDTKNMFEKYFNKKLWYNPKIVHVTGTPKMDNIPQSAFADKPISASSDRKKKVNILWMPRWRTEEGACNFFEYKDYFLKLCLRHQNIDFTFRPHPLCMPNFRKTGEFTVGEYEELKYSYAQAGNMHIDESGEYQNALLSSDILIADVSSSIWEYMPTGKPIIYTHKTDLFNEIGNIIAQGCYWVRNEIELDTRIDSLLLGKDPLRQKRNEITQTHYYMPMNGAGNLIAEKIESNYLHYSTQ